MRGDQIRNSFLLLLTAVIWGVAFVAQRVGLDYVGPFTFNAVRSFMGGLALLPVVWVMGVGRKSGREKKKEQENKKTLVIGGALCGILLFGGSSLQQIGIGYTTVGKAGFITALYIVLVPVIGIFLKRRVGVSIWVSVLTAACGLYLLCVSEDFTVSGGDLIILAGSLVFALHILVIDYFSPRVDGVKMSCIQFFVCGIIASVIMFLTEEPKPDRILEAWLPIGYAGLLSCGVAYTLQILGQKNMNPTVASLILSLESAVSVLAGWMILGQSMTAREGLGCLFMMTAIILAQLPMRREKKSSGAIVKT